MKATTYNLIDLLTKARVELSLLRLESAEAELEHLRQEISELRDNAERYLAIRDANSSELLFRMLDSEIECCGEGLDTLCDCLRTKSCPPPNENTVSR